MPRVFRLPAAIVLAAATALLEYWLMPHWAHDGNPIMLVIALLGLYGFIVALRLARSSAKEDMAVKVVTRGTFRVVGYLLLPVAIIFGASAVDRWQHSSAGDRQDAWLLIAAALVTLLVASAAFWRGTRSVAATVKL